MADQMTCSCADSPGCRARIKNGMVPFCKLPRSTASIKPVGYASMEAARAAHPGERVGIIQGGYGSGQQSRFGVKKF